MRYVEEPKAQRVIGKRGTRWWNEETEKIVKEKSRLYKVWHKIHTDQDKKAN
jgi:hypothetical protein